VFVFSKSTDIDHDPIITARMWLAHRRAARLALLSIEMSFKSQPESLREGVV